ncbi:MAG: Chitin synthase, class 5 [Vezdaea aestivalis]|nr:MAG: Chitin synthase, class 5 [Vezdaea aestivalis]
MLVSLTVGKVDAGVTGLLTEDNRLIEFPSILLPPSITSGSIVDITVSRNTASEERTNAAWNALQSEIFKTYGVQPPKAPTLRLRNATQTSVVLEWDPLDLATANLRSLSLYRNGSRAGAIPRPLEMTSTKISGLGVDTEYTFHLVLKTSAGTYSSPKLTIRTHKLTDLTGITITPGVLPGPLLASLEKAVERIGAKLIDSVRIDTTHFVCLEGRGLPWEKAVEMNIPVVRPEWVEGCEREGRIVGVRGYYLNAKPSDRDIGPSVAQHQTRGPPAEKAVMSTPTQRPGITSRLSAKSQVTNGEDSASDRDKPLPTAPDEPVDESDEESDEEKEETQPEPKLAEGPEGKAKIEDMKPVSKEVETASTYDRTESKGDDTEEGEEGGDDEGAGEKFSDVQL